MDREERGENFSSPNGSIQISQIKNWGTAGEVLKVYLSDGSFFFIPSSDNAFSDFRVGNTVSEQDVQFLTAEDEYVKTEHKALSLLEYSENSAFQLKTKLLKKGYSKRAIDRVLEKLKSAGFVDDRRFAELWIRSRIKNRPAGAPILIGHLRKRGVSREIAEETVWDLMDEVESFTLLQRAAEKLCRNGGISPEKLKKRLFQLGFSSTEVSEFMDSRSNNENC